MIENTKFDPQNSSEEKGIKGKTLERIKNVATKSMLIAGLGLALLSPQDIEGSRVSAQFYPEFSEVSEIPSNRKITRESYEGIKIPNDTIVQRDIFGKNIVITIDDCYDNDHTRSLFETLKDNRATATFFPNTRYLAKNNDETVRLWKDIYKSGFEIGYHTINHEKNLSVEELQEDFINFTKYMRYFLEEPNFSIKVVRPPYGIWDESWNSWVKQNNLFNIRWNMGPKQDGNYANALIEQNISPIVILHSRHDDARWLENNIDSLKDIANQNNSKVGGVYHSIPKDEPTEQHITPIYKNMEIK